MERTATGAPAVAQATAAFEDEMAASLCEAFADDPGMSWIWPHRADRMRRLPDFFNGLVPGAVANGVAFRSERSDAVSLWRMPGRIEPQPSELVHAGPLMAQAFTAEAGRRSQLMRTAIKARQPTGYPWWYLQFIGVRPSAQGTGLGGAAVRAGLGLARAEGLPVWVEVMNPENLGYYHHVGFETAEEFDIPDAGPHVWAMIARP